MAMAVEPHVLVDLVGDGDDPVPLAQARDLRQLLGREDAARRVARRVDEDQARPRADRSSQPSGIEAEAGPGQPDKARFHTRQGAGGQVVFVPRLQDQHLVARLRQRQDGGGDALGNPAGDGDLSVWIDGNPVETGGLGRDRFAKGARSPCEPVLVVLARADGARKRLQDLGGRVEVRQALREVDAADLGVKPRHLPDHRFLKGASPPRERPEIPATRRIHSPSLSPGRSHHDRRS